MLSNNSTESFELVLEKFHNDHWTIKLPMLSCSLTLIITCFGILVWILYHEKSAIENLSSKKNLGNMIVISLCESLIFWLVVLFIPRLLQYLLRISHFPPSYCIFHSLLGSIFMVHFLLMVDTLVVVKYLLIFVVQDPLGINDQMWSIVVNVAIAAFSVTSQLWFTYFQNGPRKLNYYICSGEAPNPSRFPREQLKFRWAIFAIYFLSFAIFTVLPYQIWRRKNKIWHEENATLSSTTQQDQLRAKSNLLNEVVRMSLTVFMLAALLIILLYSSTIDPFEINRMTNIVFFFFANTIFPPLVILTFCISYCMRNPKSLKNFFKPGISCNFVKVLE